MSKPGGVASRFKPLMTFYLTKNLKPEEIAKGFSGEGGVKVFAVKSYPYGATTNSAVGLSIDSRSHRSAQRNGARRHATPFATASTPQRSPTRKKTHTRASDSLSKNLAAAFGKIP